MSFTDQVKHEVSRLESNNKMCQLAELSALIMMNGSIQIINKNLAVKVRLYHGDLARKVYKLIKERFELNIEIMVRRRNHFSTYQNIYDLFLPPQPGIEVFLKKVGVLDEDHNLLFRIKKGTCDQ